MAGITPDEGEVELLKRGVNKSTPDDLILKLYVNGKTPDESDEIADYTECTADGYSAKTLTGANWTVQTTLGVSEASYAQQTFSLTESATVYGYFIVNTAGTILIFAEKFSDGPYNIPSGGGDIKVTPKIRLD